jgi:hypothetical protein
VTGEAGRLPDETADVPYGSVGLLDESVELPDASDVITVTIQEAGALYKWSDKTLNKYARLAKAHLGRRGGLVYYDLEKLDRYLKEHIFFGDKSDILARLAEVRERNGTAPFDSAHGPACEASVSGQDNPVTGLSVYEQQTVNEIIVSQRDEIRVKGDEIKATRRVVWQVGGVLVVAVVGAVCLGLLFVDVRGKLNVSASTGSAQLAEIDRLVGQLEISASTGSAQAGEITSLQAQVKEQTGRIEGLLIERVEAVEEIGRLGVGLAELAAENERLKNQDKDFISWRNAK